ncbi:MAG: tetratricopeptide repeat protein [Chloroflexi bacterium]|nr:tetratricopeptide repeat protein [Chloroflexota bacterium]
MTIPLLTTKFYIPPPRPNMVARPRLIERLNARSGRKLSLISAPAGFGKTTLVSEWVQAMLPIAIAWLSLDERDNDPTRFLSYFIAALQTIDGNVGKGALVALESPGAVNTESVLTTLINEITIIPNNFVLVLDDYHVIDAKPVNASTSIDDVLTFLIEHLPPQMHLVIATREDPHLPLARYRVRGQMTELRVADLRFTLSEAAGFLNQMMGLNLSEEEIAALETRTEGWIAGLQMAALSMQGRADTASFIQAFTGSHHFVMDYLVEEILQRQPDRVRSFLLQTSILNQLSGPLCDAVCSAGTESSSTGTAATGGRDGREMLEALQRGNLFVVPLDDQRQWYRYHHLFADFLYAHSIKEQPDRIPTLHRRASEWYERNGLPSDAVRHALAAEDFERVAGIAELAWQTMDGSFQSSAWLDWVKKLPDELIQVRPVLSTQYAWALWLSGEIEASEARLRDAERWLNPTRDIMSVRTADSTGGTCPEQSRRMVVVDAEQFRTLPVSIANARANNAQAQGDVSGTIKYAELVLKLAPEEDILMRGQATSTLGLAYWSSGDLEAAHKALADWINSMQKAGNIVFAVASTFALADIIVAQGHLREAVRVYKQSLQLASEQDEHVQRVIAHQYLGLAILYHEMGDQEAAAQHLLKSKELGKQSTLPDWPYRWCLAQAQLEEAQGDLEAALDLLDEAKRLYIRNTLPDIHPIEAWKARVYVRQGRLPRALAWVRERGLSVDDDLSYLREFEHIVLARVLIAQANAPVAQYKSDRAEHSVLEAIGLLERLLKAAEKGRRMGSVIEILMLQALAHQAQGNIPLALAPLERALTMAEPEGYAQIFVNEGLPMAELLTRMNALRKDGTSVLSADVPSRVKRMKEYIPKLLAAFGEQKDVHPFGSGRGVRTRDKPSSLAKQGVSPQPLAEPLSQRELEILELVAQGLSNREISEQLFLALSTVKGHNLKIFDKLGVQRRTKAVARARELGLL